MRTLSFIRNIIKELDQVTGLQGAELELKKNKTTRQLGCFTFGRMRLMDGTVTYRPKSFTFSEVVLKSDDDTIKEIVKHEYAHYMALVTFNQNCNHDSRFKAMCEQIGASADEPSFSSESLAKNLASMSKYVLTCTDCGAVSTYSRKCKVLELARVNSPLVHCNCGCHVFDFKQNY